MKEKKAQVPMDQKLVTTALEENTAPNMKEQIRNQDQEAAEADIHQLPKVKASITTPTKNKKLYRKTPRKVTILNPEEQLSNSVMMNGSKIVFSKNTPRHKSFL